MWTLESFPPVGAAILCALVKLEGKVVRGVMTFAAQYPFMGLRAVNFDRNPSDSADLRAAHR